MIFKKSLLISIVGLVVILFCDSASAFLFNIEPARVELAIKAGKGKNSVITIDNTNSKDPLHVKAYVQDIAYLPDGSNDFLPVGSTPWSCGEWITISPKELDIPAGGFGKVKINVKVPKGTKGGRYAIVFFETGPALQPGQQGVGFGINVRAGAPILVTVPKTGAYQAKLMDLDVKKDLKSQSYNAEIVFSNQSNVLVRPIGKLKILNAKNRRIKVQEMNKGLVGVLPMTSRKFSVKLEDLPAGEYTLQTVIDYGGRDLLVGEVPFKVGK